MAKDTPCDNRTNAVFAFAAHYYSASEQTPGKRHSSQCSLSRGQLSWLGEKPRNHLHLSWANHLRTYSESKAISQEEVPNHNLPTFSKDDSAGKRVSENSQELPAPSRQSFNKPLQTLCSWRFACKFGTGCWSVPAGPFLLPSVLSLPESTTLIGYGTYIQLSIKQLVFIITYMGLPSAIESKSH